MAVKASASLWSSNQTLTGCMPVERSSRSSYVCAVRLSTKPGTAGRTQLNQPE